MSIIWIDKIPIVGHVRSLIYYIKGGDLAGKAFNAATHKTAVTICGVIGGHTGYSAQSIAGGVSGTVIGGIIGGLLVDVVISIFNQECTGYCDSFKKLWKWDAQRLDLLYLLLLDGTTGLSALIASNILKTVIPSFNNTENKTDLDIQSLMEKTERVLEIGLNFNLKPSSIDAISILSQLNELVMCYRDHGNPDEFKRMTHKIGVKYVGVIGGHMVGPAGCIPGGVAGSIVGGIVGGLLVDVIISACTLKRYGYAELMRWNALNLFDLLRLGFKDGITGLLALTASNIRKIALQYLKNKENQVEKYSTNVMMETERDMSGVIDVVQIQKDMSGVIFTRKIQEDKEEEIHCYNSGCAKLEITKGKSYRYIMKVIELLIVGPPDVKKTSIDNMLQLEPGDHIVYERMRFWKFHLYDHHAIIEELNPEKLNPGKGNYRVYEQSSLFNEHKSRGKASIKEIKKPFESTSFFRIDHEETSISKNEIRKTAHYICHHAPPVYFAKGYNVIRNNCEHYAIFCVTGVSESQQAQKFVAGTIELSIILTLHLMESTFNVVYSAITMCIAYTESIILDVLSNIPIRHPEQDCALTFNDLVGLFENYNIVSIFLSAYYRNTQSAGQSCYKTLEKRFLEDICFRESLYRDEMFCKMMSRNRSITLSHFVKKFIVLIKPVKDPFPGLDLPIEFKKMLIEMPIEMQRRRHFKEMKEKFDSSQDRLEQRTSQTS